MRGRAVFINPHGVRLAAYRISRENRITTMTTIGTAMQTKAESCHGSYGTRKRP